MKIPLAKGHNLFSFLRLHQMHYSADRVPGS